MAHAVAAHFGVGHFHAAAFASDAAMTDTFVFTAIAFPVFGWTKDALAEQDHLFPA